MLCFLYGPGEPGRYPTQSMPKRFGISRLLALSVLIALFCALPRYYPTDDDQWTKHPLEYSPPVVPLDFSDPEPIPGDVMSHWASGTTAFENGEQLYTLNYRRGWEICRRRFVDGENWKELYPLYALPSEFSPTEEWSLDHCVYAARDGYIQCKSQLHRLLTNRTEAGLASEISASVWLRFLPLSAIIICILLSLAHCCGAFSTAESVG